jgi:thiamine pyrophosphate-dependent acetolactate synthase large subunit-like protein
VRLAEKLSLPVLVAPSPSRCPFPTRHPSFAGILPASIPAVAGHFDGHDLIVAFGAAIFTYYEFAEGDYLPAGAELWAVTADPDEAARCPVTQQRREDHQEHEREGESEEGRRRVPPERLVHEADLRHSYRSSIHDARLPRRFAGGSSSSVASLKVD